MFSVAIADLEEASDSVTGVTLGGILFVAGCALCASLCALLCYAMENVVSEIKCKYVS